MKACAICLPIKEGNRLDELIEKIIQIENNAQEITREAKDQQKHLPQRIDQEVAQLKAKLTAEAEHRLQLVEQAERERADAEQSQLRAHMQQIKESIEQKRQQCQTQWEEDIFRRIVS